MELFSYLKTYNQNTSFTKYFLFNTKSSKSVLETRYRKIKPGNGIIFHTYRLLNKNFFSSKYFPFYLKSPKTVLETGFRIIETGTGIIVPT